MITLLLSVLPLAFCGILVTDPGTTWTPDPDCPWPGNDRIFYFPYPGDCTKYIQCHNGIKYVLNCSDGLWWHQQITNCDYPGDYCDGIISSSTASQTTSSSPGPTTLGPDPRCTAAEISYLPHPVYCNYYIECYKGYSYEMMCPRGLFFSESRKICVISQESECCVSSSTC